MLRKLQEETNWRCELLVLLLPAPRLCALRACRPVFRTAGATRPGLRIPSDQTGRVVDGRDTRGCGCGSWPRIDLGGERREARWRPGTIHVGAVGTDGRQYTARYHKSQRFLRIISVSSACTRARAAARRL
ncbi:hypothetical protein EDC01DRAFT_431445 [Geopyxis carbonaria]|nr:hypothetical protein EDC01DRAFT_431445 [Geopyxis carbonaria]